MGLNDEMEKLRQAEEWLVTQPVDSEYSHAAIDHLAHAYSHGDLDARTEVLRILREFPEKRAGRV